MGHPIKLGDTLPNGGIVFGIKEIKLDADGTLTPWIRVLCALPDHESYASWEVDRDDPHSTRWGRYYPTLRAIIEGEQVCEPLTQS